MNRWMQTLALCCLLGVGGGAAVADDYDDSVTLFKRAVESRGFFERAYAYAVFPSVGEGGFIVGAALGKGHVYVGGKWVGDTRMSQLSAGLQAGGKAYSQIIFFENKAALANFESGSFAFSAGASAVAITVAAGASVATNGEQAGASGTENNATSSGAYRDGMAVFTVAKGGLMYAAALAGQKFTYTPRGAD